MHLLEYPEYDLYKLDETFVDEQLFMQKLAAGQLDFYEPWNRYSDYPRFFVNSIPTTSSTVPEGAKIMLHKSCSVPSTMLKKYDVITSARTDAPDYFVFPNTNSTLPTLTEAMLFINHMDKIIIGIEPLWYYKQKGLTPDQYLPSIVNFMLNGNKCEHPHHFEVFDEELHNVRYSENLDDTLLLYAKDMLPQDRIVNEDALFIGEDKLTYDVFKSCYLMSKSSDLEMCKAALITLAQHDCHGWEELIHWLLFYLCDYYKVIQPVKRSHSPFRWLYAHTGKNRRSMPTMFVDMTSISMGRKLVTEMTEGAYKWEMGVLMKESYYRPKEEIEQLANLLN